MASGNQSSALQSSEYEEEIEYDHPDLPEEIMLRKRFITKRLDIFESVSQTKTIQNEKELRC